MSAINNGNITGRIYNVKPVEGKNITSFSIGYTSFSFKEKKNVMNFINCVTYSERLQKLLTSLNKGQLVTALYELLVGKYNGTATVTLNVIDLSPIGSKNSGNDDNNDYNDSNDDSNDNNKNTKNNTKNNNNAKNNKYNDSNTNTVPEFDSGDFEFPFD